MKISYFYQEDSLFFLNMQTKTVSTILCFNWFSILKKPFLFFLFFKYTKASIGLIKFYFVNLHHLYTWQVSVYIFYYHNVVIPWILEVVLVYLVHWGLLKLWPQVWWFLKFFLLVWSCCIRYLSECNIFDVWNSSLYIHNRTALMMLKVAKVVVSVSNFFIFVYHCRLLIDVSAFLFFILFCFLSLHSPDYPNFGFQHKINKSLISTSKWFSFYSH